MSFDATTMTVFGMPPYLVMAAIGFVISFLIFNCIILYGGANQMYSMFVVFVSIPALFIGAKFFGILLNIADCIYYGNPITLDTFLRSGIVFYGGLLFFLMSVLFWTRRKDEDEKKIIIDAIAVSIPIFHLFGRIGCYMAGCCYGICNDGLLSVQYTTFAREKIITAQRVPIQLVEALLNGIIFVVLLYMAIKRINKGKLLYVYFFIYSIVRFVDEFFRGDFDRNVWPVFSMAQIVSIIIFGVVIFKYIRERLRKIE